MRSQLAHTHIAYGPSDQGGLAGLTGKLRSDPVFIIRLSLRQIWQTAANEQMW